MGCPLTSSLAQVNCAMVSVLLCVEKFGEPREKLHAALVSTCINRSRPKIQSHGDIPRRCQDNPWLGGLRDKVLSSVVVGCVVDSDNLLFRCPALDDPPK